MSNTAKIQVVVDLPADLRFPGQDVVCTCFSQFKGQVGGPVAFPTEGRIEERFNFFSIVEAGRFIDMTEEFFGQWEDTCNGEQVTIRTNPIRVTIGSERKGDKPLPG